MLCFAVVKLVYEVSQCAVCKRRAHTEVDYNTIYIYTEAGVAGTRWRVFNGQETITLTFPPYECRCFSLSTGLFWVWLTEPNPPKQTVCVAEGLSRWSQCVLIENRLRCSGALDCENSGSTFDCLFCPGDQWEHAAAVQRAHINIWPRVHAASPCCRLAGWRAPLICNSLICCHFTQTSSGFSRSLSSSSFTTSLVVSSIFPSSGTLQKKGEKEKKIISKAADCYELTVHFSCRSLTSSVHPISESSLVVGMSHCRSQSAGLIQWWHQEETWGFYFGFTDAS